MRHNSIAAGQIMISWRLFLVGVFGFTFLTIYLALGRIIAEGWREGVDRCQCQCQIHLNPTTGSAFLGQSPQQISSTKALSFPSVKKISTQSVEKLHPLSPEQILSGTYNLDQDDPRLLAHIRQTVLRPPPSPYDPKGVILSQRNPHHKPAVQLETYRFVIDILKNMTSGFFLESGANDGELYSNTLPLELVHNWSGLLVEPDPKPVVKLLQRRRNAWIAPVCLSTKPVPEKVELLRSENNDLLTIMSAFTKNTRKGNPWRGERFTANCYPLFSLLAALNVTTVDYFSLDVEGAELYILKTIPWKQLLIKVLSIEVPFGQILNGPVHAYMTSIGYRLIRYIQNEYSHDNVYIHPTLPM